MIRAYTQAERTVEGMTKEEACNAFAPKILATARRVYTQVRDDAGMSLDDLCSFGVLGLLEAFDRYSDGHGIDFPAFAEYRIRGAMLDAMRTMDTFTRRRRDTARKLKAATEKAKAETGREPTAAEIATAMGASLEEYWLACDIATPVSLVPMDEAMDTDGHVRLALTRPEHSEIPSHMVAAELRDALRNAIAGLPERERQVVMLYYGRDMNLAEIGATLGVTPSRVCQVLSMARGKLKAALAQHVDGDSFEAMRESG